jgi:hypothetical protein
MMAMIVVEMKRPGTARNGGPAKEFCKGCLHGKNYSTRG